MMLMRNNTFRHFVVLILAGSAALAVAPSVRAQQVVFDPTNMGTNISHHAENIENFFTELANAEEQLRTALQSTDLISSAYAVSSLLGSSPKLQELITTASDYRSLYSQVLGCLQSYQSGGLISARQLAYSVHVMNSGIRMVMEDVAYVTGHVLKDKGLSANDRLSIIGDLQKRCSNEIDKLLTIKKKMVDEPAGRELGVSVSRCVNATLSPVPSLGPVRERTSSEGTANDAAVGDPLIQGILSEAGALGDGGTLDTVRGGGRSVYRDAVNIVSVLIGIVAALLLLFAFEKRNRGEHQSVDAIYKVCVGLVFSLVALQILSRLFLF